MRKNRSSEIKKISNKNDRCVKESRKRSDKRTNEPVQLTETLHPAFTAIVNHHVSIMGSISFLVVRLGDSAPSPPLRHLLSRPLEAALAFQLR